MDLICDGYEFDMYLYLIHIKFISITYQIHMIYVMCCTKMSCSVDPLLFLQIQMSSYIYFIETVSNTYQIHINYIFCWASLCNFCFSSNQDFIIHLFIWNYIKYISITDQIHINYIFCCIKMSCSVDFLFFSKSRFYHKFNSLKLYQIHIKLARAVGVAVGRRSGGRLETTLVATKKVFNFLNFFFFPFFSRFSPPSSPFLIEGVLGSKNLFSESGSKWPIT